MISSTLERELRWHSAQRVSRLLLPSGRRSGVVTRLSSRKCQRVIWKLAVTWWQFVMTQMNSLVHDTAITDPFPWAASSFVEKAFAIHLR